MIRTSYTADTKEWQRIKKQLLRANKRPLQVGWFEGDMHSQATEEGPPIPLAQLASWLHGGTVNMNGASIPPRPFITEGFMVYLKNRPIFERSLRRLLPSVIAGVMSWEQLYSSLGNDMVELLQMVMDSWSHPSNAPLTIALKGRDDPLDKTGELISKIKWRIGDRSLI